MSFEQTLGALEQFWDLECPRFGDQAAKGWCNTLGDLQPAAANEPAVSLPSDDHESLPPFSRWLQAEEQAKRHRQRPLRTTDDDEQDPFRIVLFDDIRGALFKASGYDAKKSLVFAYMTFMGLPFVPPGASTNAAFFHDHFVRTEFADRAESRDSFFGRPPTTSASWDVVLGEPMQVERTTDIASPFSMPFVTVPAQCETLFNSNDQRWLRVLRIDGTEGVDLGVARFVNMFRPGDYS